ncbi:bifunctional 23S rRNA (guanine(2069)-N(7))-methyltransferase RlmK/23S rRNA (guanine(2445)-N(2))-methyltransferase RlmL [Paraferrimonas sedimenticola]|uniref:Ribosomal RNA large subunit methyltransferase K/L n=1 Tax=Paraferrimonas sedimenticola TaxID=375674 RepID=A0AA37RVI5_9GAMM|nr:bifunctional 23S rRNA (guanine(2069)-N(7))-methyltransferase RlmK/23S rRNA (guanine(2445)-N(2))-methyltransferase RlmL [Paraferrimonas sedimenticola]GLP96004.1 ribosomal RNA large subunit methyltransferase K/L [Paraferrimonas sedimenticola]
MYQFFAAAPRGFEYALAKELTQLGADGVKEAQAGAYFQADLETAYRICMWARLPSRIVLILYQGKFDNVDELYEAAFCVDWPAVFSEKKRFLVDFVGTNRQITNTQFGALKVKDAVVDRFREDGYRRPDVSKEDADIRISARIKRDQVTLGFNFSGAAMHQRGYREKTGEAPLKENLACNLLARSGWWEDQKNIVDPFCGSATILIEAAMIAAGIAPGLNRVQHGFTHWRGHNAKMWHEIDQEALALSTRGTKRCPIRFVGIESDPRVVKAARTNVQNAGVAALVKIEQGDALTYKPEFEEPGYVISNPPFGERLGNYNSLLQLYFKFGQQLKTSYPGYKVSLLSSEPELLAALKLKYDKKVNLYNGNLECEFCNYRIREDAGQGAPADMAFAQSFINRIKKNRKPLDKWARKENLDCYRIYDADIPEYNVAVDRYQDYLVVQEYAPPANIPPQTAQKRLNEVLLALPEATDVHPDKIVLKTRLRQKGSNQYQKREQSSIELKVHEYGALFKVDLAQYLDTGLFLDHRLTRKLVGEKAKDKTVLNLFAYTGSASVHAALGGAKSVTTVDMSRTYLAWAQDNFDLNGLNGRQYQFEQADCLKWIATNQKQFDLIFIDPPTFSNSKRMDDSFDVERDHVHMLAQLKQSLAPGGEIIFTNNKRRFKMDTQALEAQGLKATNIDAKLLPQDFKRNPHIHNCWSLRSIND